MNFSEKYGNDVDEAVELALKDLKVSRDDVEIEILEEPSKGFLGLGSKLAKVRVIVKEDQSSAKNNAEDHITDNTIDSDQAMDMDLFSDIQEGSGQKNNRSNSSKKSKRRSVASERPEGLLPADDHIAVEFLKRITAEMGLELEFKCMANDENVYIDISGNESGNIIGKRGQTLDAVQYLTSLVVNKDKNKYVRVILDAENYRVKREKTLQQLADRLAGKVIRTRRSVRLEPMNPYERMVIHAALQNNKRVTTKSEGEEPYRRLIIDLKK